MAIDDNASWFITGCSTGLGRALAETVLKRGWRAAVTARQLSTIQDFPDRYGERALAIPLDVTKALEVEYAVRAAEQYFGCIDVLINNAGRGYAAAVEEGSDEASRRIFDVNFFGPANIIRAVVPGMRRRRFGWIVNVTSIGGLIGRPGSGYYAASKFAVEGLSESLAYEVAPLGIRVLTVQPASFRTEFRSAIEQPTQTIKDYAETVNVRRAEHRSSAGRQPGDPLRGAEAILRAITSDNPPQRLLLGKSGIEPVSSKLCKMLQELGDWNDISVGADFPDEVP